MEAMKKLPYDVMAKVDVRTIKLRLVPVEGQKLQLAAREMHISNTPQRSP
ncbi:hypothetical protein PISMIDRAFT_16979 [Pisolithus microcarpus 441]|uniref:Uncharacterized protein n=1 Tax=Pisolithus microcarpus 441 TaxID=765257 RepID=A0A0C9YLW2_9AGAM|nr:hypothetical protein BKA83DRAFT_16979 [Pisolithus microcarpus]KIK14869.1 hypothetical protein PISMIDRAFT_16979 [Pisolithus microcarpus 441]